MGRLLESCVNTTMDADRILFSLHDGQLLQWIKNEDSGAFRIQDEEPEDHVDRCPRCGSPTLEQIEAWLCEGLRAELFGERKDD